jgi:hypothetical protein
VKEKILEDHPEDHTAAIDLIRLYLERGDYGRAGALVRSFERRREQHPQKSSGSTDESPVHGAGA